MMFGPDASIAKITAPRIKPTYRRKVVGPHQSARCSLIIMELSRRLLLRRSRLQSLGSVLLSRKIPRIWRRNRVSQVQLTVNGKQVSAEVEDRTLLVHLLRDHLNLTGTHVGCDTSQCGACVVHI